MTEETTSSPRHVERRLHERYTMQLPVRVASITGADIEPQYETVTANISSGGIFLRTDRPLPIASKISLEFLIAFKDLKKLRFILAVESLRRISNKPVWVKATGVVIRHEENGMALIFDNDYRLCPMDIAE